MYDLKTIAKLTHKAGAFIGLDLAHAIGNVPLNLHDWNIDCAVWCHYKYLNSGPGSVGGAYIHEQHYKNNTLPRLAGWWGDKFPSRFDRHINEKFDPEFGANGWQISSPSPLQTALLETSLALFEEASFKALRKKSIKLTSFLEKSINNLKLNKLKQLTPKKSYQRGAQLSFTIEGCAKLLLQALIKNNVICDVREPNILRVAPCPLYNSFQDIARFIDVLVDYFSCNS